MNVQYLIFILIWLFHSRTRGVVVPPLEIEDVVAIVVSELGCGVNEPSQEGHHIGVVRLLLLAISCCGEKYISFPRGILKTRLRCEGPLDLIYE